MLPPPTGAPLLVTWSGGRSVPDFVGNLYTPFVITPAIGTANNFLLQGQPGYFITEMGMQWDSESTIAVPQTIDVRFVDSDFGTMFNFRLFLPRMPNGNEQPGPGILALPTIAQVNRQVSGPGFFFNNKLENSILTVSISQPLVTGAIRVFLRYGFTQIVG